MYDRSYYYSEERLVFLTKEDARNFFFTEQIYIEFDDDFNFGCFLDERYSRADIFRMTDEEKADVLFDYHDVMFEQWVSEELTVCDMYED